MAMIPTPLLPRSAAGALAAWLLPGLTPYQRTLVANLLAGFVVDILVVGAIKGIVKRGCVSRGSITRMHCCTARCPQPACEACFQAPTWDPVRERMPTRRVPVRLFTQAAGVQSERRLHPGGVSRQVLLPQRPRFQVRLLCCWATSVSNG